MTGRRLLAAGARIAGSWYVVTTRPVVAVGSGATIGEAITQATRRAR